jgi:hypothetical protein
MAKQAMMVSIGKIWVFPNKRDKGFIGVLLNVEITSFRVDFHLPKFTLKMCSFIEG